MPVAMMKVGVVQMAMPEWSMHVRMTVRLARRDIGGVRVLMVLVVPVEMVVLHHLVHVLVLVVFGEVEPDADRHERRRQE